MKKLLLACVLSLLATSSFAVSLTGKITDNSGEGLFKVSVKVGDEEEETDDLGEFLIDGYSQAGEQAITYELDGYKTETKTIKVELVAPTAVEEIDNKNQYTGFTEDKYTVTFDKKEVKESSTGGVFDLGVITMETAEEKVEIIKGSISFNEDKLSEIDEKKLTVEISGEDSKEAVVDLKSFPDYTVTGFIGDADNTRNYTLTFKHPSYNDIVHTFDLNGEIVEKNIKFKELTLEEKRQDNLTAMTGFGCNDLMPKYLVGADCIESSHLQGDASDIALWIQKFGGQITSLIGMLSVVLIVWNAFNIVTAAGDQEQISQGKKGIMWTVIGLAVTMFAYIIVKTVIALTYTT